MSELARLSIFRGPPRVTVPVSGPHDETLAAIIDAPLSPGETAHAGFSRKERELGAAFAQLPLAEARRLHARLSNPRADDSLASRFSRFTIERRTRLLAFLADAPRRAALAR